MQIAETVPASLARRLGAMLYDALLVLAIWFITVMVLVTVNGGAVGGLGLQVLLFLEAFLFFAYFWRTDGQTVGMMAWAPARGRKRRRTPEPRAGHDAFCHGHRCSRLSGVGLPLGSGARRRAQLGRSRE